MSGNLREKTRRWGAWAGTRQDLQHIVAVIEKQIAPVMAAKRKEAVGAYESRLKEETKGVRHFEEAIANLTDGDELRRIQLERSLSQAIENRRHYVDIVKSNTTRFDTSWRLQIETTDRNGDVDKQSGTSEEIIRRIDPKATKRFAVRVPSNSYLESHSIEFEEDYLGRLVLTVASDDSQWTLATVHEISAEIDKHRLAWGWLRRFDIVLPIALIASAVLWFFIFNTAMSSTANAVSSAVTLGFIGTIFLWLLIQWTVPATQILHDGKKPRAIALGLLVLGAAFQLALTAISIFSPSLFG